MRKEHAYAFSHMISYLRCILPQARIQCRIVIVLLTTKKTRVYYTWLKRKSAQHKAVFFGSTNEKMIVLFLFAFVYLFVVKLSITTQVPN